MVLQSNDKQKQETVTIKISLLGLSPRSCLNTRKRVTEPSANMLMSNISRDEGQYIIANNIPIRKMEMEIPVNMLVPFSLCSNVGLIIEK
ncbi:MAG: hypothetical protein WCU80_01430 [Paludibacteraceae bacterium]